MQRAPEPTEVERFVVAVVTGGVALVAGLRIVTALPTRTAPWLAGAALVAPGVGGWPSASGARSATDRRARP
jgi:hypothetical protein